MAPANSLMLSIAGLRVQVEPDPSVRVEAGRDYAHFLVDPARDGPADLTIHVGPSGDRAQLPTGERLFRASETWELYRGTADDDRVLQWSRDAPIRADAHFSADFSQCDLRIDPWPGPQTLTTLPPLVEIGFQTRAARLHGGFLVHAVGLDLDGVGLLLPGSSGRGKSTLAELLPEAAAISDERVAVAAVADSGFAIHGTPWRGTAKRIRAACAPLRAVVFLGPHEQPASLRPLPRAEAFRRLVFHAFPPWWDRPGLERVIDQALAVVSAVPTYEMRFVPDASVIDLLAQAIEA
ncbi:hypothetical protein OAX78_00885 [Planctomycetota bacterium]|nr:hypothetical protein [Planctomycetota bacterium]